MKGFIFDIQRFSIFDGPGIRTNVFFKGCDLRCRWCHNPESQRQEPQLMFYAEKCVSCGKCTALCGKAFTPACSACGKCSAVCPRGARKISGYEESADVIIAKVLRDKEFYNTSGGGVTLSGGEPLLQADFAAEILRGCKEAGIHTAIETAAHVPAEAFKKVMPFTDLFLCDVKCVDAALHKELTGADNARILANAEALKKSGREVLFRMPVIPGLNDHEVARVKEFAGDFPLELLAYHKTGCGKYDALCMPYTASDIEPPAKETMQALADTVGAIYNPTGI